MKMEFTSERDFVTHIVEVDDFMFNLGNKIFDDNKNCFVHSPILKNKDGNILLLWAEDNTVDRIKRANYEDGCYRITIEKMNPESISKLYEQ